MGSKRNPMLAATCDDKAALVYPLLASPKLDGVRATVRDGVLMSRSLKPIPNRQVQEMFAKLDLPEGLDGELILGDPTAKDEAGKSLAYLRTVSAVMRKDTPFADLSELVFYTFDIDREGQPFNVRIKHVANVAVQAHDAHLGYLKHETIHNAEELLAYEDAALDQGYEGVMVRSLGGPYKHNRSTAKEGYLLKVKRFVDSEAVIVGVQELQHNENAATQNELGHTERSSHKAGQVAAGVLGALVVRDLTTGVEHKIGTGFTAKDRAELWAQREEIVGRIVKYKYFPQGSKDKPRFPVWLGWRAKEDMDATPDA